MNLFRYSLSSSRSGYTLVELSIVTIIIGLLTAGGLAAGASMVERAAYIDTRKLIDQLHRTLKDHYIVTGRLPCAARIDLAPGNVNFGAETDCTAAPIANATWSHNNARIGAIPTRALGLPDSAAGDKFGNRFVYAVAEGLTSAATFGSTNGTITVLDVNDKLDVRGNLRLGTTGTDGSIYFSDNTAHYLRLSSNAYRSILRMDGQANAVNTPRMIELLAEGNPYGRQFTMYAANRLIYGTYDFGGDGGESYPRVEFRTIGGHRFLHITSFSESSEGHLALTPYPGMNVGIGTVNPQAKLHVSGSIQAEGHLAARGGNPTVFLRDTDNHTAMLHANDGRLYVLRGATDSTSWDSTRPLTVDLVNSRVGINNVAPAAALDVKGGKIHAEPDCRIISGSHATLLTMSCNANEYVLSGGGECATEGRLSRSYPASLSSWTVRCRSYQTATAIQVTGYAICCRK